MVSYRVELNPDEEIEVFIPFTKMIKNLLEQQPDIDRGEDLIGGPIQCTSNVNPDFSQMIISSTVLADYLRPDTDPFNVIISYLFIVSLMMLEIARAVVGR